MNSFLCFCCFILLALFCSNGNAYENSVGRSRSFLPSLLVSAATTGNDGRKARAKHRTIQPNRRKNKDLEQGKSDEDSDQEEEDGDDDAGVQWTSEYLDTKQRVTDKLKCKYRKSCYEGVDPPVATTKSDKEGHDENEKHEPKVEEPKTADNEIQEDDKEQQKLSCKYRYSCYAEKWPDLLIPPSATYKKPASLKKIAQQTLKELEEKELQNSQHPRPKHSHAKQRLMDAKESLEHKNKCKYRKSCYENGELPEFEESAIVSWLANLSSFKSSNETEEDEQEEDDDEPKNKVRNFEEMNTLEQKLFCKYRFSCYPNGSTPQRRTAQPKSYTRQTKQDELPITPAKETTKEFCDHQEDIKGEAEMAVKLQQKKNKRLPSWLKRWSNSHQNAIVEGEPEEILEEIPEEEASEEPETPEESTNLPLLSKAECKYRKSCL
uniref:Uncharacterized protein n=1 Tax=Ditylenchus dipsaci TaxID=166011 RepID=A0A915CQK6_9BILA